MIADCGRTVGSSHRLRDRDDEDLIARRAGLEEMRDTAMEDLLECRLESSRDAYELSEVIGEAKELVRRRPLRERGHGLLIRALTSADRAGEASVAFEQAAAELRAASGLDPGKELSALYGRCLQRDPSVLPAGMRRVLVLDAPSHGGSTATLERVAANPIRAAMVDIGARFVTVIDPHSERRRECAGRFAQELALDMGTGVVQVSQSSVGQEVTAEQVVASALSGREGATALSQLLVVLVAEDTGWAQAQAERILAIPQMPFLLVLAPRATDLPGEYVLPDAQLLSGSAVA